MNIDLKPFFDAARTADDEVQRVMHDMNAAFNDGTDEGKQRAVDLRPMLDDVQKKAIEANQLYISMKNTSNMSSVSAENFVPVPQVNNLTGEEARDGELKREEFIALDAAARMAFIKGGGKVTA